jgi:hypothetical protein
MPVCSRLGRRNNRPTAGEWKGQQEAALGGRANRTLATGVGSHFKA